MPTGAANEDEAAKLAKQRADIERRAAQVSRSSAERHEEVGSGFIKRTPRHKKPKKKKG